MESLEIHFNKNKLNSFLFKLNLMIHKRINEGYINNEIQCLNLIESEIIESDNTFIYGSNEALINLRDQIFSYFFDQEFIGLPLTDKIKELSLLN